MHLLFTLLRNGIQNIRGIESIRTDGLSRAEENTALPKMKRRSPSLTLSLGRNTAFSSRLRKTRLHHRKTATTQPLQPYLLRIPRLMPICMTWVTTRTALLSDGMPVDIDREEETK